MFRLKIVTMLMVTVLSAFSQKTSLLGGPWNLATTWLPLGVPGPADDVIINGAVTINANAACNSIQINSGGSLSFSGNSARTLTVSGNTQVNSGATFQVPTNSNATHTISLGGNLTVDGVCRLVADNNSRAALSFRANADRTLTGVGSCTLFQLSVNVGASASSALLVSIANFTASSSFLTLQNGMLRLSPGNASTLQISSSAFTVPGTAGLAVSTPSLQLTTGSSLTLAGRIELAAGSLLIGDSQNEDLISAGGTVCVSGGSITVGGKYVSTAPSTFSITSGIFTVPGSNSSNTSLAPFNLTSPGSTFHMTGGTILLRREGGGGSQNLGMINTGASNVIATGGTVQVGESTTPSNQIMTINSNVPLPNLVIANSNARANLAANTVSVTGNVAIESGSLMLQNGHLVVGGNWTDYGGLSAGTGTVTFASNASQNLSTSAPPFNELRFSGSGTKTFSTDVFAAGTFSIAPGTLVDVSTLNRSLIVQGAFVNDGTFLQRAGNVTFSGTANQQISGNSKTTFHDLTLSNNAGATLQSDVDLEGALHLLNGTLNVNNRVFTLLSGPATNARIAQITGGDISGNITAQRYVPSGYTGWAFLGAPISASLTLAQWDDDTYITCPTCPDGFMNFYSVYTYDETAPGSFDAPAAYVPLNGLSDPVTPGKGFWIYLGNGQTTSTSFMMDVTGPPQKFGFVIPLNYTNHGSVSDDGWNLIANPYPSPISWTALHGGVANVDDAIYVYNADLAAGSGAYASFVNGASSPMPVAGGIGDEIPAFQGFYVHSTGGTLLNAQESIKVGSDQPLLSSSGTMRPMLRLHLAKAGRSDEALLYCDNSASEGFDKRHDAFKLGSSDPLAPVMAIAADSSLLQISGIPFVHGTFTTGLVAKSGYSGTYTVHASQLTGFPETACISLYDRITKISTDLRTKKAVLTLPDTCTTPRFILRITSDSIPLASSITPPTCTAPSGGMIIAKADGSGPWDFSWSKKGNTVRNTTGRLLPDTLDKLDGGSYELTVSAPGQCAENNRTYSLAPQEPVIAQFNSPSSAMLQSGTAVIAFTSNCTNAASISWTFDNLGSQSGALAPVHTYTASGHYTVELKATSITGCKDSLSKQLWVMPALITSDGHHVKTPCAAVYREGDNYVLYNECSSGTSFRLTDGSGRTLMERTAGRQESFVICKGEFAQGVYYLTWSEGVTRPVLKLVMQ